MQLAWGAALGALAFAASFATAAGSADPDARALAAGCASCHQPAERTLPSLAGQSRDALLAELRGFRDGSRNGTVMPQLARGYTDSQLDAIATYLAARPAPR